MRLIRFSESTVRPLEYSVFLFLFFSFFFFFKIPPFPAVNHLHDVSCLLSNAPSEAQAAAGAHMDV